ncbi:MAG: hypothetical protein IKE70_03600 [Bacilli bacterium]|nr:hypothetical protein [Bacilli bacterium]
MVRLLKRGVIIGIIYLLLLGFLFLYCSRIERLEKNGEINVIVHHK